MPQRVTNRRIPTPELQGTDSYIEVREISYKIRKQLGQIEALTTGKAPATEEQLQQAYKFVDDLILSNLAGWNWVDDVGEPMPLPKTPDDLDRLTMHEAEFIVGSIKGKSAAEAKN